MDKAIEAVDAAVERLPAVADDGSPAGLLAAGAREGLLLGRETVSMVRDQLAAMGAEIDPKLLRIGNDAGQQLYKSALSAQQAQYQAQRDDDLARLIQIIAEERAKDAER